MRSLLAKMLAAWLAGACLNAAAAPFCALTADGKRCIYQSFAACLKATGQQDHCSTNQAELKKPLGQERFCVVTASANQCLYPDAESCRHAASASGGSCMVRGH